jgi:hypothetical protein
LQRAVERRGSEVVQYGLTATKTLSNNHLGTGVLRGFCKMLIRLVLRAWLAALDDFRNWLIREAA